MRNFASMPNVNSGLSIQRLTVAHYSLFEARVRRTACAVAAAAICCALGGASPALGDFLPPNDPGSLVNTTEVKLDAAMISELSKQFTNLAGLKQGEAWSPAIQRRHCQILALALALDPANQTAKQLNTDLAVRNQAPPSLDTDKANNAALKIRQATRWLASEQAGAEANKLANLATDILSQISPQAPAFENYDTDNKAARWAGVVPELSAFASSGDAKLADNTDPDSPFGDTLNEGQPELPPQATEPDEPVTAPTEPASTEATLGETGTANEDAELNHTLTAPELRLDEKFTIRSLGKLFDSKGDNLYLRLISLELAARAEGEGRGINYQIRRDERSGFNRYQVHRPVETLYKQKRQQGITLSIDAGSRLSNASMTRQAIELPLAIGLEAVYRGEKPREDLVALGRVGNDGAITASPMWWTMLKVIRADDTAKGRLLIPADIADDMQDLIALNEPEFFHRFEVIAVSTLREAIAASFDSPDSDLAEASQKFNEFQQKIDLRTIRKDVLNSFVQERFAEIINLAPNHISAINLALQGSGRRPSKLSKRGLAHEAREQLEATRSFYYLEPFRYTNRDYRTQLDNIFSQAREQIDPLARLIPIEERDFYTNIVDLVNYTRTLSRELRLEKDVRNSLSRAKSAHSALETKVSLALGEPDPNAVRIPE